MKKGFLLLLVMACLLTSCVDFYDPSSPIQLASDQRVIGTWQDLEAEAEYGLRFTRDEQFYTMFLGEFFLRGSYIADGSRIELSFYDCEAGEQCHVVLGYTVTENTLIISDATGDIRLRKIGN